VHYHRFTFTMREWRPYSHAFTLRTGRNSQKKDFPCVLRLISTVLTDHIASRRLDSMTEKCESASDRVTFGVRAGAGRGGCRAAPRPGRYRSPRRRCRVGRSRSRATCRPAMPRRNARGALGVGTSRQEARLSARPCAPIASQPAAAYYHREVTIRLIAENVPLKLCGSFASWPHRCG